MHLNLLPVPGYELSSDEKELPLQPDDPADGGSALDGPEYEPCTINSHIIQHIVHIVLHIYVTICKIICKASNQYAE